MEKDNLKGKTEDRWQNAAHEGDWRLSESETDSAELLTSYQADAENNPKLYATGSEEEDNDDEAAEEQTGDWGHTDPLDDNSPFPDSNDPSGPGSAV